MRIYFNKQFLLTIFVFTILFCSVLLPKDKIIIGIHGLKNKPPKDILEQSWRKAIQEGLEKNEHYHQSIPFKIFYWANLFYKYPSHFDTLMCYDDNFNPEVYYPARKGDLKEYKSNFLTDIYNSVKDGIVDGTEAVAEKVTSIWEPDSSSGYTTNVPYLKEIEYYFSKDQKISYRSQKYNARIILKELLKSIIEQYQNYDILVIAHSMGSWIAYDFLHDLEGIEIEHFITIGSPLGLNYIKKKLAKRYNIIEDSLSVPNCVLKWTNYCDIGDLVCAKSSLHNEYIKNNKGVEIVDDNVSNNYYYYNYNNKDCTRESEPSNDSHKSYGYLRTPEISKVINEFLSEDYHE